MTIVEPTLGSLLAESCIPVLETGRLMLRVPRIEDVTAIVELANNRKIAEMTARIPHPYSVDDAQAFVAGLATSPEAATYAIFIKQADGPVFAGMCGLSRVDEAVPELGYWLGEPYWHRGLATEAARALIDYAFGEAGMETIAASARVVNPSSRRVLEKCGFQWTGAGLTRVRALGASVPVDRFRLDRRTWASLRAWGSSALPMRPVAGTGRTTQH